jgi:hypothetical protein
MISADSPIHTAEAGAKIAGCSPTYLRKLLSRGEIPGYLASGTTWLTTESVLRQLRTRLTARALCNRDDAPAKRRKRPGRPSAR